MSLSRQQRPRGLGHAMHGQLLQVRRLQEQVDAALAQVDLEPGADGGHQPGRMLHRHRRLDHQVQIAAARAVIGARAEVPHPTAFFREAVYHSQDRGAFVSSRRMAKSVAPQPALA